MNGAMMVMNGAMMVVIMLIAIIVAIMTTPDSKPVKFEIGDYVVVIETGKKGQVLCWSQGAYANNYTVRFENNGMLYDGYYKEPELREWSVSLPERREAETAAKRRKQRMQE